MSKDWVPTQSSYLDFIGHLSEQDPSGTRGIHSTSWKSNKTHGILCSSPSSPPSPPQIQHHQHGAYGSRPSSWYAFSLSFSLFITLNEHGAHCVLATSVESLELTEPDRLHAVQPGHAYQIQGRRRYFQEGPSGSLRYVVLMAYNLALSRGTSMWADCFQDGLSREPRSLSSVSAATSC